MGELVIACYRPKSGRGADLLRLAKEHVPALRRLGLVTDRPTTLMRASDGTLLEVFEWTSSKAVEDAHEHPTVKEMWNRFEQVCTYQKLGDLAEADQVFAHFQPID